jgi:hypothetical protein
MCSTCETMQRRIAEAYLQGYEEGLIDGTQLERSSHLDDSDGEESPTIEATDRLTRPSLRGETRSTFRSRRGLRRVEGVNADDMLAGCRQANGRLPSGPSRHLGGAAPAQIAQQPFLAMVCWIRGRAGIAG